MLSDLVYGAVVSLDGAMYAGLDACPHCGGAVKAHDIRKKRFATVGDDRQQRTICIFVQRYYCTACGRLCYAESPFYPDTRLGAPIIDFCVVNARLFPYHHVSKLLERMHILLDRGSVRNYATRNFGDVPFLDMYGMRIPLSLLSLIESAFSTGKEGPVIGAIPFGSGRLPPADRALLSLFGGLAEGKKRNKQEKKEKGGPCEKGQQ
ncbi:MAG: hypothetical protein QCH35_00010 [Methanomicrobiaceae archaeon]|nr:hypothetical protein [Methanomicrobiaceae archaeon]